MKQPEDTKTLELAIETKRGRGRPPKANALDQAERARRYRAKLKAEENKNDESPKTKYPEGSDGANTIASLIHQVEELNRANKIASQANTSAYGEINALKATERTLRQENDLLVYERAAAWKEIEKLKSDALR